MTLDEFIERADITPKNAKEKIQDCKRTYWGSYGNGVDFQCSPKGLILNRLLSQQQESKIQECIYTWDEVYKYVTRPQQLTLW